MVEARLENNLNKSLWTRTFPYDLVGTDLKDRYTLLTPLRIKGKLSSQKRDNHTIEYIFASPVQISLLEVKNKTAGKMSVDISSFGSGGSWTRILTNYNIAHNKERVITMGSFVGNRIIIELNKGSQYVQLIM